MNEGYLRNAQITTLRQEKAECVVTAIGDISLLRQKISPDSTATIEKIPMDEARIIFNRLDETIKKMKQIQTDIEYKESL